MIEPIRSDTIAISEYGHYEETHSYLLLGEDASLLIDSGLGISNIREITDAYVNFENLHVIATHAHWDHIGGHTYYKNVYVHKNETSWLVNQFPLPESMIKRNFEDSCFKEGKPEWFHVDQYHVYQCKKINEVGDGFIFNLGNRHIECILTPGHSPGHLCFLDTENKLLFSGDCIYYGTIFLNYPSTDPDAYHASIQKLCRMSSEYTRILPAHHTLEIDSNVLFEIKGLLDRQRSNGELRHGAGIVKGNRVALSL